MLDWAALELRPQRRGSGFNRPQEKTHYHVRGNLRTQIEARDQQQNVGFHLAGRCAVGENVQQQRELCGDEQQDSRFSRQTFTNAWNFVEKTVERHD